MNAAVDHAVVAAALLVSVAYALLSLGPRAWRRRTLAQLAAWAARAPAAARLKRLALRLEAAAGRSAGCGGCGSCADGAAGAAKDGAGGGGAPEIRIPASHIARRR